MNSEQIIQRLLDDKKITVKEAMVILKDLAKIGYQSVFPNRLISNQNEPKIPRMPYEVVVMYGVQTNPYTYCDNATTNASANSIIDTKERKD